MNKSLVRPAVLFARSDSIYKTMDCDVWDKERDALTWPGGAPVVAHPPCRLWGRLRHFSTAPIEEKSYGPWAVDQIREWGGVLEHPANSTLWPFCGLPHPSEYDEHGFTISLPQWWFGHKAEKWTWLYICGMKLKDLPQMPLKIGEASHVIATSLRRKKVPCRPKVTRKDREATPPAFAAWLLEVASICWKSSHEK